MTEDRIMLRKLTIALLVGGVLAGMNSEALAYRGWGGGWRRGGGWGWGLSGLGLGLGLGALASSS
jgi:hypothetical protein